jgi:uncharacterized membrane protein YesL
MLTPLKTLWAAVVEFYYDLPRMVFLNVLWFITALPFLFVAFWVGLITSEIFAAPAEEAMRSLILVWWAIPAGLLTLALAGPGTAALYHVTNRFANGELLEVSRFWYGFRRFFWRGWGLASLDAGAGTLILLNIVFYGTMEGAGLRLLSLVFLYLLILWFAIQGYLFSLLVELDQPVLLVVRNALFLVIDNLGLTLGLTIANAILLVVSVPLTPTPLLPLASMVIGSNMNNKVIVQAVNRYRAAGRVFKGDR